MEGQLTAAAAGTMDAERNAAVGEAARRHDASPHQIVLAWLLGRSPQILPIPGSGDPGTSSRTSRPRASR